MHLMRVSKHRKPSCQVHQRTLQKRTAALTSVRDYISGEDEASRLVGPHTLLYTDTKSMSSNTVYSMQACMVNPSTAHPLMTDHVKLEAS